MGPCLPPLVPGIFGAVASAIQRDAAVDTIGPYQDDAVHSASQVDLVLMLQLAVQHL